MHRENKDNNQEDNVTLALDTAPLRARRARLKMLFNKGAGNSREILSADFGHWPPRGLRVTDTPQGPVRIYSAFNPVAVIRADVRSARISIARDQDDENAQDLQALPAWRLNWLLYRSAATDFIRNAVKRGDGASAGFIFSFNSAREIFMRSFNFKDDGENTLAHEHIHILQGDRHREGKDSAFDNRLVKGLFRDIGNIKKEDRDLAEYLMDESEIQVRLHVILATAYQFTQALPENATALRCLLYACGMFDLNKKQEQEMEAQFEKEAAAGRPVFIHDPEDPAFAPLDEVVSELDFLHAKVVRPRKKAHFSHYVLPALYAGLMDLYGAPEKAQELRAALPAPRAR